MKLILDNGELFRSLRGKGCFIMANAHQGPVS
jgi:hypothetical protein